jgi:hypothetical protein
MTAWPQGYNVCIQIKTSLWLPATPGFASTTWPQGSNVCMDPKIRYDACANSIRAGLPYLSIFIIHGLHFIRSNSMCAGFTYHNSIVRASLPLLSAPIPSARVSNTQLNYIHKPRPFYSRQFYPRRVHKPIIRLFGHPCLLY